MSHPTPSAVCGSVRPRGAFTPIELLTVIGILAAVLIPPSAASATPPATISPI